MSLTIKWNLAAVKQFDKAIEYIASISVQNAQKVETGLINAIQKIAQQPEFYPRDKYKLNNDGSFRAFELHRYRISYRYIKKEIRILRVRHTSMNPLPY
ncbi:MAG: type II toxin-antitoxin system RelE/ParE family toxin [Bacteroidetes bacterium]|nr:type II toxin-antitoxin system RelE/ParE family toxin [Bacteroidota bacterium]MBS1756335.1 type II toxin-antitoxin system RelE/ParE family toxin [Bacteroidota bacterium]MBS1923682.1 type II toxin-antitoxin system RelE/ParE family toxin [Bacteroidota bacterium]